MSEFSKIELNKKLRSDEKTRNLITNGEKKEHGITEGKANTRDAEVYSKQKEHIGVQNPNTDALAAHTDTISLKYFIALSSPRHQLLKFLPRK